MSTGPIREIRAISAKHLLSAAVCLLLALAFAPSAWAASGVTKDKGSPVVGESITFTESAASDCPQTFTFTVDGAQQPPQTSRIVTRSFDTSGSHTVSDTVTSICNTDPGGSLTFDVRPGLAGSIAVSPDPPHPNQTATLTASQTGGYPGYTYAWDTDNDGNFDNGTTRIVTPVFTTTGPHVVHVRITDSAAPPETHVTVVDRTLNVVDPPPPGTTPPPAPPDPPCVKRLAFALSEFTTDGCFAQTGTSPSARWETTSAIKLNGIPFGDFGQTFTITFPTSGEPGGHFTAPNSSIQLGGFTAFSGDIDWTLPAGGQGDEKELRSFSVLAGTKMFSLNVRGSVALRLGWGANGAHYATFPLNIELPASFRAGPDPSLGRVTGAASLRVDLDGIHYDGLKLQAADVWVGRLKVVEACFSFVPSGGQSVAPCEAPSLDGSPYLTCSDDVSTDRWDGSAVIELPGGGAQLAAFGGLANGQVSKLGGFADNLGRRAPIAPNVFLNRVGVGLCLTPPPLQLRGDVGIAIFPTIAGSAVANINGHVTYTDATATSPWTLEVGGSVKVFDTPVGSGSVTLRSYGGMDFHLQAGVNLYDVVSLDGAIDGWVDPSRNQFAVSGSVKACVGGGLCATGSGAVSHTGVAGCITIVSTTSSPDLLVSFDPLSVGFDTRPLVLSAGFGYRWGASSVDILGGSCDFGPYLPSRSLARAAGAGTGIPQRIARGTTAVSWRIHGTNGPPKIVIRGPHGTTIASPMDGGAKQSKGHWMLAENTTNATTNVLLVHPAAGTWTVAGVPGAASAPTTVDSAKSEAHPTIAGNVRGSGGARTLEVAYAVPPGASVRLVERAKGISRTIAGAVHGHRCSVGPKTRPGSDQAILCARVRFRPSRGPGGIRKIQAVVTRGPIPLEQKDIASFRAPKQTLPSRVGRLRARRANGFLVVAFPRSRGASRYAVSAALSDGRLLAFDLAPKCRAVRIAAVPAGVAATVKVTGVRYDLATGGSRSISIKSKAASAGPKGKLPGKLWRPACS